MKQFLILGLIIISSLSYGQQRIIKTIPSDFHFSSGTGLYSPSLNPQKYSITPFEKKVSYPAFFCRLELKAVDHLHVWVKFHAGEYDSYADAIER
jgi:hypothetical protein